MKSLQPSEHIKAISVWGDGFFCIAKPLLFIQVFVYLQAIIAYNRKNTIVSFQ